MDRRPFARRAAASTILVALAGAGCLGNPPPRGRECKATEDCDGGRVCVDGTCRSVCSADTDCAPDEECTDGVCLPVSTPACRADADCASRTPACAVAGTPGRCVAGACVWALQANGTPCDDQDACTDDDRCVNGLCRGISGACATCDVAADCDDQNPCTGDDCVAERCAYVYNAAPCNDGDLCTTDDLCALGQCGGRSVNCDDQNPCTSDSCVVGVGCAHRFTCACDDAADCDDDNPCTTDLCNGAGECTYDNRSAPCDDGNACTGGTVCAGGACGGGTRVACDDQTSCTLDSCDPTSGCVHTSLGLNAPCNDGNPCTVNERCDSVDQCGNGVAKSCDGSELPAPTCWRLPGTCAPTTGECGYLAQEGGVACGELTNPCADDRCDGAGNCVAADRDGQACTDDQEPCTDDVCAGRACTHPTNTGPCGDGTICQTDFACVDGECVGASACPDQPIAAAYQHACALRADGAVACWGANDYGQLGNGTTSTGATRLPQTVQGLTGAVSVCAGLTHSCAVRGDGTVWCWGRNIDFNCNPPNRTYYSRLGNNPPPSDTTTWSTTPVQAVGITTAVQVACSHDATCARLLDGTIQCWGFDYWGQLGDGGLAPGTGCTGITGTLAPGAPVSGINTAVRVAMMHNHVCALLDNGSVRCWGTNTYGQLGSGGTDPTNVPLVVQNLSDAVGVTVGDGHACAPRSTGAVACWGLNNLGQLGNGTTSGVTPNSAPVAVLNITSAAPYADAGWWANSCVLLDDGALRCWGKNNDGKLGDNSTFDSPTPVVATSFIDLRAVATGLDFSCALRGNGQVWCWGDNSRGQLGNSPSTADSLTPVQVAFP